MTAPTPTGRSGPKANELLKHMLGFFPRVDAKLSLLLTLNLGMLGILASAVRDVSRWEFILIAPGLALVLLAASFWNLYRASLPRMMESRTASLIYFRAVAEREEAAYVDAVLTIDPVELERDLARQAWRNAVILTEKFTRVDRAFRYTALAALPWAVWLAVGAR